MTQVQTFSLKMPNKEIKVDSRQQFLITVKIVSGNQEIDKSYFSKVVECLT